MIRFLIIFLAIVGVGSGAALTLHRDTGYALLRYGPWTVETSLAFLVLALVLLFIALIYTWKTLVGSFRLPGRVATVVRERRSDKARESLQRGLVKMSIGRWKDAEVDLIRRASQHDMPLLNYLGAARAAQAMGAADRRDHYLQLAQRVAPNESLAILLTQADLQIRDGKPHDAIATLHRALEIDAKQPLALRILVNMHEQLGDWEALRQLLPTVYRLNVVEPERWEALYIESNRQMLLASARHSRIDSLHGGWETVPRSLRKNPRIVQTYAELLARLNAHPEAIRVIEDQVNSGWNADLVHTFGQLQAEDPVSQLATVEVWLKKYGDKPELQAMAGQLCLRSKLWGRARSYLEAALTEKRDPETLHALARLCEQTNEPDTALLLYREATERALGTAVTTVAQVRPGQVANAYSKAS